MAKQVWQTEDGFIFRNEQEAVEYEQAEAKVSALSEFIQGHVYRLDVDEAKDLARELIFAYTVTKK